MVLPERHLPAAPPQPQPSIPTRLVDSSVWGASRSCGRACWRCGTVGHGREQERWEQPRGGCSI